MLPLAAGQCSLWFTAYQSIIGGLFGSVGFFINILLLRWIMAKYQAYKENKDTNYGGRNTEQPERANRDRIVGK